MSPINPAQGTGGCWRLTQRSTIDEELFYAVSRIRGLLSFHERWWFWINGTSQSNLEQFPSKPYCLYDVMSFFRRGGI